MLNKYAYYKIGFTLVELAIGLVIMGFLSAGVLLAKDLVRAAELRSVISQEEQIKTGVNTFIGKFNCVPGDCSSATAFWGQVSGTCDGTNAGNGTDQRGSTATCNGNGNGAIENSPGSGYGNEVFLFWKHLANAGLIAGDYSGVACATGAFCHTIGVNAPSSKLSGNGFGMRWIDNSSGATGTVWKKSYTDWMTFGGDADGVFMDNTTNALFVNEAYNIDNKIDDGKPGTGKVAVYPIGCSDQAVNTNYDVASYLLTSTSRCVLIFKIF